MTNTSANPLSGLPRWITMTGPLLGFALLTLFFILLRFPYDLLAQNLLAYAQNQSGVPLSAQSISARLGPAGPGFEAQRLSAFPPEGSPIVLERLLVLPAWSWSWFSGDPTFYVEVDSRSGNAVGRIRIGDEPGFDGTLRNVDLSLIPIGEWLNGVRLAGRLDSDSQLVLYRDAAVGTVHHRVRDGSLSLSSFPIALPFQKLTLRMRLGGGSLVQIEDGSLEGPVLDAQLTGTVAPGQGELGLTEAPLDLELRLRVRDPAARAALQSLGARLTRDGTADLRVAGTSSNPVVR